MTAVLGVAAWIAFWLLFLAALWWVDARREKRERRMGYLDQEVFWSIIERSYGSRR